MTTLCGMEKCCATCRFWLAGYTDPGWGWCDNAQVQTHPQMFINGQRYEGGAGVETLAVSHCEKYTPVPVRYRTK